MSKMIGGKGSQGDARDADDFPGVGADVLERNGLKTHFGDAVVPTPGLTGAWGGSTGGDTSSQGLKKGDAGKIPEQTFVSVQGAPKPGGSISASASGAVANKKGRGSLKGTGE